MSCVYNLYILFSLPNLVSFHNILKPRGGIISDAYNIYPMEVFCNPFEEIFLKIDKEEVFTFNYSVSMLQHGRKDYLLKTVKREKVQEVLQKLEKELMQKSEEQADCRDRT